MWLQCAQRNLIIYLIDVLDYTKEYITYTTVWREESGQAQVVTGLSRQKLLSGNITHQFTH